MKIISISDTHNCHNDFVIPKCDVLVHSGDFTNSGSLEECYNFIAWLNDQIQCRYKVVISGNHDTCMENRYNINLFKGKLDSTCHYLDNIGVIIDGIHFFGTPYQHRNKKFPFYRRDFNIPKRTNILITHYPPYKILDNNHLGYNDGCKYTREKVDNLDLLYHFFGHIYSSGSRMKLYNNTIYVNSCLNMMHKVEIFNNIVEINL